MATIEERPAERIVGRYALYGEIAAGGMATVHFGRLVGPVGFSRTVAIKRLHPQFAKDPEFVSMFLDEARVAARIQHPNVVSTLDVVALEGELFLVMEYIQGESLARLLRSLRYAKGAIPPRIVGSILSGVLHGLHAAHEAKTERGAPLGIVHRDISPQNVLIGTDGVARVLDFGVAKAAGRVQTTREGQIKGKLAYMAPEQLRGEAVDRRTDVYGAAVVLWESLANRRLFDGDNEGVVLSQVLAGNVTPLSYVRRDLPLAIDTVVQQGLSRDPMHRFQTAREMAIACEEVLGLASPRQVGEWLESVAGDALAMRAEQVKEIESISSTVAFPGGVETLVRSQANFIAASRALAAGRSDSGISVRHSAVGHSQVSSISVSKSRTLPPSRRTRTLALLLGLLASLGAVAAFVVMGVRFANAPTVPTMPESAEPAERPSPAPAAAGATTVPSATVPAEPSQDPPKATASAVASAPAARSTMARPIVKKPPAAAPKPMATPPPPTPNCSPPYTIDAAGIRRIKPECL